jgi:hypothetical protein
MLMPTTVFAQETDRRVLFDELMNRQAAASDVVSLERVAARIFYVESIALLSEYGDWPMDAADNWPEDAEASKFLYDVKNIDGRMTSELANFRRIASRSRSFTDPEKERFTEMVADLALMVEQSKELYALLLAGDIQKADEHYRGDIQSTYLSITVNSYTMTSDISHEIRDINLKALMLE